MSGLELLPNSPWGRGAAPVIRPVMLTRGTLETCDMVKTRRLGETLGFECRELPGGRMLMRHGSDRSDASYWVLEVKPVTELRSPQNVTNHWGIWVPGRDSVNAAYEVLASRKDELGLTRIQNPRQTHDDQRDYGFYFEDTSRNWWEISEHPDESEFLKFFNSGDWDQQEGVKS